DFNNLLTGTLGHADLALLDLLPDSPAYDSLRHIETAARRAAELTKQLLAYSGKGRFVVTSVNLSTLIQEMVHLLEVSISKKCIVEYECAPELPAIEADASQIRQIIMNLIINASEAIGDQSGLITVRTRAMHCTREYLSQAYLDENLPEGQYVCLEVIDTGCGMSETTRTRIFDPFFTTKFTGRGLGLAAVLGIVRGHHGAIQVTSEPGVGTTFRALLPASLRLPAEVELSRRARPTWKSKGLILVADDEETVRRLARKMLENAGFTVLTANDGQECIEIFVQHAAEIRAVLLDVTMPRVDGREAFYRLQAMRPGVPVILSSGFNEQDVTHHLEGTGLVGFVQKPYVTQELLQVLRHALEG
ncbi:MAG: response regulator, partial [FCB group bacterium]|nr:response regulator [FCB group bacterium]